MCKDTSIRPTAGWRCHVQGASCKASRRPSHGSEHPASIFGGLVAPTKATDIRLLSTTFALALGWAASAWANDWGFMATISNTMGIQPNRLCMGEGSRGDIGCPAYAPYVSATSGFVGIGTNQPLSPMHISGTANSTLLRVGEPSRFLGMSGNNIYSSGGAFMLNATVGQDVQLLYNAPGNSVGIRLTNNPSTTLHVSGTIRMADGGEVCNVHRAGAMRYTSASTFDFCDGVNGWQSLQSIAAGVPIDRLVSGSSVATLGPGGDVTVRGRLDIVTGTNVVAVGRRAGSFNSGVALTALGHAAGENNTGGSATTVGAWAGQNNTGNYLTAVGQSTGGNNTGAYVTAVGSSAAQYNAGVHVTAIGLLAGQNNSGNYVTAIGHQAASLNSGTNLTAVGQNAGGSNIGNNATLTGHGAGQYNAGANLTAVGLLAGSSNVGDHVTAVGQGAGQYNSGTYVAAFGAWAGQNNSASEVTAIGGHAGQYNTGGQVAVLGTFAARNNTGGDVIAIGVAAARYNAGNSVTAIGTSAAHFNSASNLTAVGRSAGYNNTGLQATMLGTNAGFANTYNNVTLLGYGVTRANRDNQVVLGNGSVAEVSTSGVYAGRGVSVTGGVTATYFSGDGSRLTGLPGGDRIVSGTTSLLANRDRSITITTAGTQRMIVGEDGQVGIGRTNPDATLDVSGTVKVAGTGDETCAPGREGTLRVHPFTGKLQICRLYQ